MRYSQYSRLLRSLLSNIGRRRRERHQKPTRGKRAGLFSLSVMGNESSTPVGDDVPPCTLESRTLDALAKYIKSGRAKKIVVMVGDFS